MRFENLEQIDSTKTRHIGAKNESKNQYKHIYPYDETLGTLTFSNLKWPLLKMALLSIIKFSVSLSTGKYINASKIELNGKSYIASQGPKPNTIDDFWQLINDHKIKTVVSLCQMYSSQGYSNFEI